ncbi:5-oxoprolinase subunit PxpB [Radiobacillus kanasensis]|uniref:5-oxoprolinase subunit PxpB n=1 Tax=Radiobacillus kanasensis TaxID=2844358 RepID=UPI001E383F7C|nr:5-oxoprolinase subunit PxpB [Radiobacillus kanasensis]UFT98579.1 5-oxoprolinase subunit PxpB [Radiobacillus kanasensis]
MNPHLQFISESALLLEWEFSPSLETNEHILAFHEYLQHHPFPGYVEGVPAYTTLTIHFQPLTISGMDPFEQVRKSVLQALDRTQTRQEEKSGNLIQIPVCYDSMYGPDLTYVASYHGFTEEKVISIHTNSDYPVYFLGFAPGFPFLGGMDPELATPRKQTPRQQVAAGSVGIASSQTGVYPLSTPGGWQIIGRTPLPLVTTNENQPTLLQPGDTVRFVAITAEEFEEMEATSSWD